VATNDRVFARRHELFARAAPVFRRYGYRGATLKAVARVCGMSIPGLYRYFPSKRSLALFPLPMLYPELHPSAPDVAAGDARMHLSHWIDAAVAELPNYTLALRLALEMGLRPDERRRVDANLRDHVAVLASLAQRARPGLDDRGAFELASSMVNLVTGPALSGLDQDPRALPRELRALMRGYGVRAGAPIAMG